MGRQCNILWPVLSAFDCLMWAGSAICCGHAVLSSFNCLMWAGSAIYCGQSCRRLIALCGPAVQYTVASHVVVCHRGWRCNADLQYHQVYVRGSARVHRCLPAYLCVISARPYPLFIAPVHGPARQLASCSPERYSFENLQPA